MKSKQDQINQRFLLEDVGKKKKKRACFSKELGTVFSRQTVGNGRNCRVKGIVLVNKTCHLKVGKKGSG